jgi:hypothetical protein
MMAGDSDVAGKCGRLDDLRAMSDWAEPAGNETVAINVTVREAGVAKIVVVYYCIGDKRGVAVLSWQLSRRKGSGYILSITSEGQASAAERETVKMT